MNRAAVKELNDDAFQIIFYDKKKFVYEAIFSQRNEIIIIIDVLENRIRNIEGEIMLINE
jgi:hypothetical protein